MGTSSVKILDMLADDRTWHEPPPPRREPPGWTRWDPAQAEAAADREAAWRRHLASPHVGPARQALEATR